LRDNLDFFSAKKFKNFSEKMPVGKPFRKDFKKADTGFRQPAKPENPAKKQKLHGQISALPFIDKLSGVEALTQIDQMRNTFIGYIGTVDKIEHFVDIFLSDDPHHWDPMENLPAEPPANAPKKMKDRYDNHCTKAEDAEIEYKNKYVHVWNVILNQCSDFVKQQLKKFPEWHQQFTKTRDPLWLWQKCVLIMQGQDRPLDQNIAIDRIEQGKRVVEFRSLYSSLHQGPFESLQSYYDKFQQVLAQGTALGEPEPHPHVQAERFIVTLDRSRYGKLQKLCADMLELKRADAYPEDLPAAYNLAADHKVPVIVHQSA
jgi:hypothetical protein